MVAVVSCDMSFKKKSGQGGSASEEERERERGKGKKTMWQLQQHAATTSTISTTYQHNPSTTSTILSKHKGLQLRAN